MPFTTHLARLPACPPARPPARLPCAQVADVHLPLKEPLPGHMLMPGEREAGTHQTEHTHTHTHTPNTHTRTHQTHTHTHTKHTHTHTPTHAHTHTHRGERETGRDTAQLHQGFFFTERFYPGQLNVLYVS